ncbi:SGNH/GDSL hydrolase family protein [Synechococcus sp. BA-132 BA5]|nr:SGNH/GDSL hydrolase family protein [Synechococcus sp. BA-132 BA5]
MKKALVSVAILGLTTIGLGSLPLPAKASIPALTNLFVFGDSLSDGGNAGLLTGGTFPPSPPYVGGRASNGEVAVEYLWNQFNPGNNSFNPSAASGGLGTNYALFGSTTGTTNNVPAFSVLGNSSQLQQFNSQNLPFNPSTSLFVVWFFPNDLLYWSGTGATPGTIGNPSPTNDTPPAFVGASVSGLQQVIANAVNNIATSIEILTSKGATNFLVPNSPNLGSTPFFSSSPSAGLASFASDAFNSALSARLDSLQASLNTTDIIQFQADDLFSEVINQPADYGLVNTTDSCFVAPTGSLCSNPDEYLFWDGNHPTTAVHRILGSAFYDAVRTPVPGPLPGPLPVSGPLPVFGAAAAFGYSRKLRKRMKSRKLPLAGVID